MNPIDEMNIVQRVSGLEAQLCKIPSGRGMMGRLLPNIEAGMRKLKHYCGASVPGLVAELDELIKAIQTALNLATKTNMLSYLTEEQFDELKSCVLTMRKHRQLIPAPLGFFEEWLITVGPKWYIDEIAADTPDEISAPKAVPLFARDMERMLPVLDFIEELRDRGYVVDAENKLASLLYGLERKPMQNTDFHPWVCGAILRCAKHLEGDVSAEMGRLYNEFYSLLQECKTHPLADIRRITCDLGRLDYELQMRRIDKQLS